MDSAFRSPYTPWEDLGGPFPSYGLVGPFPPPREASSYKDSPSRHANQLIRDSCGARWYISIFGSAWCDVWRVYRPSLCTPSLLLLMINTIILYGHSVLCVYINIFFRSIRFMRDLIVSFRVWCIGKVLWIRAMFASVQGMYHNNNFLF